MEIETWESLERQLETNLMLYLVGAGLKDFRKVTVAMETAY